jgi:uncharacterized protein
VSARQIACFPVSFVQLSLAKMPNLVRTSETHAVEAYMRLRLTAFALVAIAMATQAEAASFDCNRARTPDEKAVCKNPGLSELDSEMAALWYSYKRFPFLMGASGVRQDDARQFLADRRQCGANVGCLRRVYQARIKALKAGIRWGMQNYTQQ